MSDEERQRRIAEAAYHKARERGFQGDRHLDDWLEQFPAIAALSEEIALGVVVAVITFLSVAAAIYFFVVVPLGSPVPGRGPTGVTRSDRHGSSPVLLELAVRGAPPRRVPPSAGRSPGPVST